MAALAAILWDFSRAPADQWSTRASLAIIDSYQARLSPRMSGLGFHCRFQPTCSHYGEAVIARFGWPRGPLLALGRILRCGPWTPLGTYDPPEAAPPLG